MQPQQLTNVNTQEAAQLLLMDPSFLSIGSIQSEAEGWTITRVVGALQITSINDFATGVSVGWRWTFGIYQGSRIAENPDPIEAPGGAEVDWLHTRADHVSAHAAADFTPTWMQQPMLTYHFDVRVQRKMRGTGQNIGSGNQGDGTWACFSIISENLDVAETLDVSARLTWRLLLRKPGR